MRALNPTGSRHQETGTRILRIAQNNTLSSES